METIRLNNLILQEFHRMTWHWYRGGRDGHCYPARQRAYQLLLIRHNRSCLLRHAGAIRRALDRCENEVRGFFGLEPLGRS